MPTTISDNDVTLLKAGVATGPNKASATPWPPVTPTLISYTWSDADLAGFTASDINAVNFGVQVSASAVGAGNARVDYIQISVTYADSSGHHMMTLGVGA